MATDTMQKSVSHYENMRDSGIEWIGAVPSDWSIYALGQLAMQVKNKNLQLQENNLLSLSYGKIKRKNIETTEGLLPASFDNYNIIDTGDTVLRLTDLQNDHTSLRVGLATEKGIITSAYVTLRPKNLVLPAFMYYVLHAFDIRKGFYGMGAGVRQGLNFEEVRQIKLCVPSHDVQQDIVEYLNQKCALIESFIVDAKNSIEEYKAWKSSIIYEAVTKGFNPNVETKDSGIEWIGKIPVNSFATRLKYIVEQIQSGTSVNSGQSPAKDEELGILKTSCVSKYFFNPNENKSINRDEYSRVTCSVKKGTIIVSRMNTPELVGACGYVTEDYPNLFLPDRLWQVSFKKGVNVRFVWYFLQSHPTRQYYASLATGTSSSMQNISQAQFLNAPIIMLSEAEQRKVVAFLDKKCELIEELIAEKSMLISDLESYKKALIYEVVTGKRKVI